MIDPIIDVAKLSTMLEDDEIRIDPMTPEDREPLRLICAQDTDIWQIYALSYGPDHFDASFDALLRDPTRLPMTIRIAGTVAGMTVWINPDGRHRSAEIGNTYLAPGFRGTGANGRIKRLLFAQGFAVGLLRIQLTVDTRNQRSQAACLKVGATREGTIRNHLITWTGHRRDSALFSIVAGDWRG